MTRTDSATGVNVPGPVLPKDGDRFAAWLADVNWAKLFPEGRELYYEGEHPDKFAKAIREEFGLDPSEDPLWGKPSETGSGSVSYGFHCPAEKIDAIYGEYATHRFPGEVRILHD